MPKKVLVRVNGNLRNIDKILVRVNGALRNVKKGLVRVNGVLREFWSGGTISIAQSVQLAKSTNNTTKLVTLTGTNYRWTPSGITLEYYFERSIDGGSTWPTILDSGPITNPGVGGFNTKTYLLPSSGPNIGVVANALNYYRFRVYAAVNPSNTSGSTSTETVTVQGPTNITVTVGTVTASSISISWGTSTGAAAYIVYRSTDNIIFSEFETTSGTSSLSVSLPNNTTYYFKVLPITGTTSANPGYSGNMSNTVSATTLAPPSGLGGASITGTIREGLTVTLNAGNWNAGSSSITSYGYTVEYFNNTFQEYVGITTINTASTSTTYSIPSNYISIYGSLIRLTVAATNAAGTSTVNNTSVGYSVSSGVTAPGAPTGLTATDVGSNRSFNDGRIDLSWTAPSNNGGSAITGYRIERSTDGSNFSTLVSNTGSTSVSYSNTGLTSAQIYYYRVSAINSAGTGSASNTASATATTIPQAPTIGTASRVNNTQVSVGFTTNANGGQGITSLIVASSPTVSLSYSGTSSPVTVTGSFALNQAYTFTVRTVNANGSSFSSASSNSVTPNSATVPTAPTNLSRSSGSGFTKTFTWSAPSSNGGSAITGYQYSVDGGSSWFPTTTSSSQNFTYSVTSATFAVRAVNAIGGGAAASMSFTIPTVTTPTASSITSTSATVSWTSTGQSSFSLSGVGPNSPYGGTTATSVNVTGLSAATNYSPVVTITSPTSDTVTSSAGSFTTSGGVVAPSNVQVTVTSSGQGGAFIPGSVLTATFTASGTTPFSSITYQWQRSTDNVTWSNVGTNSNQLSTNSTYNNRFVRCRVTVTNSAGNATGTSPSYFMSDAV